MMPLYLLFCCCLIDVQAPPLFTPTQRQDLKEIIGVKVEDDVDDLCFGGLDSQDEFNAGQGSSGGAYHGDGPLHQQSAPPLPQQSASSPHMHQQLPPLQHQSKRRRMSHTPPPAPDPK